METGGKSLKLLKDIFIFALGSLGSKLISFLLVPLYTNVLTRSEYGVSELALTIAELLIPFVSVVIFESVLRFGLDSKYNKEDVILTAFRVALFGSLATILITPFFNLYSSVSEWKWYICAYVIIYIFYSVEMMYLKVKQKNKLYALLSCVQTLVLAISNIILLLVFKIGIRGYLLSNIISHFVITVSAFILGKIYFDIKCAKFEKKICVQMLAYSFPLIFNNIAWWIIHSSDKIMIEWMLDSSLLGLYTVSIKISAIINLFVSVFSQAWSISAIREYDGETENSFYANVFKYYSFICFLGAMIIISVSAPFMKIYVGKNFLEAAKYVPLLVTGTLFSALTTYFSRLYSVVKKNKNVMFTTVFAAVVNIAANYILIKSIGVLGAVIGTCISYFVMLHLQMINIRKYVKVKINYINYSIACVLVIAEALAVTYNFYSAIASILCITVYLILQRKRFYEIKMLLKNLISQREVPENVK